MKTLFFTAGFCILFLIKPSAQPTWTSVLSGEEFNKSYTISNAYLADSLILVSAYTNAAGCATNNLFAFDLQGEMIWQQNPPAGYNQGGKHEIVITNNAFIYTAGYSYHDDYYTGNEPLTLVKMNPAGEVIFEKHYSGNWNEILAIPNSMDINDEGEMIVSTSGNEGKVFKSDVEGTVLCELDYDFEIMQVAFLNEEDYLILSPNELHKCDPEGNITGSVSVDENPQKIVINDDFIYLLYESGLVRINNDFSNQVTLVDDTETEFRNMKLFQEQFWIMGIQDDEIIIFPFDEENEEQSFTPGMFTDSPDFLVVADQIIISGTSPSGQLALYSYPIQSDNTAYPWPDIEISDFNISNIGIEYWEENGEPFPVGFHFDTELFIQNNGPETVNEIFVYSPRSGGFNCVQQFYYRNFNELSISPGESITIDFGYSGEFSPPSANHEICFEVMAPNSLLEIDVSANLLCKSFNATNIEKAFTGDNFKVFPNPASDRLFIEVNIPGEYQVYLYDHNGKLIRHLSGSDKSMSINISEFAKGLYFLKLRSQNGETMTKKIVRH
ncbi:MAG: T9SS type A sorting domain-containing protein [Bacteroidales bacterium]